MMGYHLDSFASQLKTGYLLLCCQSASSRKSLEEMYGLSHDDSSTIKKEELNAIQRTIKVHWTVFEFIQTDAILL